MLFDHSIHFASPDMSDPIQTTSDVNAKRPISSWRRKSLLLLGVACIIAMPAYIEWFMRRPVGEGPAGPRVQSTAFESRWTDRPVLLLGIGDSVTRGLGAKTKATRTLKACELIRKTSSLRCRVCAYRRC